MAGFTVVAGKYEADGSRNYKFIGTPHATIEAAEAELATVTSYPFSEIEIDECPGAGCMDQGCPAHYAG